MPLNFRALAWTFAAVWLSACEISDDLAKRAEPPSAEGRPYPNLASVPNNPRRTPTTDTAAEVRALEAERQAAQQADAALRAAGLPDAPPEPVRLAPVGANRPVPVPPAAAPAAVAVPAAPNMLQFASGAARLTEDHRRQIRALVAGAALSGGRVRVLAGWTSPADRAAARTRAQAVAAEIIGLGVPANRVDIRDQQATAPGQVEILVDY